MRSIRTIAPLAVGLVALAVAGCQSRPDQTATAAPTPTTGRPPPPAAPHRPRRPAPPPSRGPPRTGDDRRPVAGQDPGAGEDAPGPRRRRPPALAAVAGAGLRRLCQGRDAVPDPVTRRWARPPTTSASATPSGRPPCAWPSPSARAPAASGSSPGSGAPRGATRRHQDEPGAGRSAGSQLPRRPLRYRYGSCLQRPMSAAPAESGRRTRNDAPPPGRSWTQACPPCSSAKRATRERPMPMPGRVAGAPGPWRNGSNRAARSSRGTPAPASSTARSTPRPGRRP